MHETQPKSHNQIKTLHLRTLVLLLFHQGKSHQNGMAKGMLGMPYYSLQVITSLSLRVLLLRAYFHMWQKSPLTYTDNS